MTKLASALITDTERLLYTGGRDDLNLLNGGVNASVTSLSLAKDLNALRGGSFICIDTELMYVWEVNDSALSATVLRGWRGSTAATHSDQAEVQVNPRFSRFDIFNALNDDLDDLSAVGLYQVASINVTYNSSVRAYNLTGLSSAGVLDVLEVKYDVPGPSQTWPVIPPNKWRLKRQSSTTDFASTMALELYAGGYAGRNVRITYKAPFTRFAAATDDAQTNAGLAVTMNDLPPMGAALRLTSPREVRRNFDESQGDTRRPEEVPAGANLGASRGIAVWRGTRIQAEKRRLSQQYPDYTRV